MKQAKKARKRFKTIANTQLRDLERKMTGSQVNHFRKGLDLYYTAVKAFLANAFDEHTIEPLFHQMGKFE